VELRRLVVSAKQKKVLRTQNLEAEEQYGDLEAVASAVDVVAAEQVVRLVGVPRGVDDLHQGLQIPVGVPENGHGRVQLDEHGLTPEYLSGLEDDLDHVVFRNLFHLLSNVFRTERHDATYGRF